MNRENGEPAFPIVAIGDGPGFVRKGLTQRDYFAGQALTGLELHDYTPEAAATLAYKIADAMMEEMNKK